MAGFRPAASLSDLLSGLFQAVSAAGARRQEVTLRVDDAGPVGLDGVGVAFDDEKVVSDAGIMLLATLTERLGIERLVDEVVLLPRERPGAVKRGSQGARVVVLDGARR